jgi:luciferase family oxidoreductase group 1
MTKLSILDLVHVNQNSHPLEALQRSLKLAQRAEDLGYERFWVAEHHNMPSIASAATSVVIGFLAGGTKKIRIGAGGIMLPNHSPLVIAEQFGTLATLYPGRIDLGLGRAPGTDQRTLRALRRDPMSSQSFPQDVQELQYYFEPAEDRQAIVAVPGAGLRVPIWILGSSIFGAQLAGELGLPYAFASHFAPDSLHDALRIYRSSFRPSKQLKRPYAMMGVNVIAAESDQEAQYLFTSLQQAFANLRRGYRGGFLPPVENMDEFWTPEEKLMASHMLSYSVVGSPGAVRKGLRSLQTETGVDEFIVVGSIFDSEARIRSFEIVAEAGKNL